MSAIIGHGSFTRRKGFARRYSIKLARLRLACLRRTCLAACISAFATLQHPALAEGTSPHQQLAFDIYKELVELNTVTATGDTARAAEAIAARLRAAGFADADIKVFSPAPRKGNLVARLHGTGARKPILLLAHIDVVPANR